MDKVGLAVFEHVGGCVPFLHNELVRDAELVEDQVENLYVVSGRLPLTVDELKRTEVPVADNDQRILFGIAETISSMDRRQKSEKVKG